MTCCLSAFQVWMQNLKKQFGESFFKNDDFPIMGWQIVTYMSNCYLFFIPISSSLAQIFWTGNTIYPSRDFMLAFTRVEKLPSGWNYFFHFQSHAIIIFREFIHQQEHIINVSIFNKHSLPFNFQFLATLLKKCCGHNSTSVPHKSGNLSKMLHSK